MPPIIEIKGTRDGILIIVEPGDWTEIRVALFTHIDEQIEFLKGAQLTLDVGGHKLKAAEMGSLRDQLSDREITLQTIISQSAVTERSAQSLGIGIRAAMHIKHSPPPLDTTIGGEDAILTQRTLRSGHSVKFSGHVVVVGDVNPGAEIVAHGNILVWGRLRGSAHAGVSGDKNAFICALELIPQQLRIAEQICQIMPKKKNQGPQVARLKEQHVYIDAWQRKQAK
ncbi:MAG: septum site-determining protein MinC [Chloroflexi bacterium]|nr:septum site-determining protein MinC [Chloroflexota bacterium]